MVPPAVLVVGANGAFYGDEQPAGQETDQPVALMPALNRPLIAQAVVGLIELGVERIIAVVDERVVGPVREALERLDLGERLLGIVERSPDLSMLTAVARAGRRLGEGPLLLRFADSLSRGPVGCQLDPGWDLEAGDALILTSRFDSIASVGSEPDPASGGSEDPDADETDPPELFAGAAIVGADFWRILRSESAASFEEALGELEASGGHVERRYVTGWWRYRRQADPVLELNRFLLHGQEEQACGADVVESDLEGAVACDTSARIIRSVIRGPVLIGPEAEIKDSFIGPCTTIGEGVAVEGSELENSVVLDRSSIAHVGGRIDSSVIGPRARITRDFRMPRGTRLRVGPGAKISLQ